jgi:catechol 2,3-dioxygenase-like lactoylglutathione lyase family enzyme
MPIGRLDVVAIDCPDPHMLADFYRSIIGGRIVENPDYGGWVELHTDDGRLAFQKIDGHRPPTWPEGDVPQQAHVDVDVDDLDAAEPAALELGARKADHQPSPDNFRVFVDPAGHPFCLVRAQAPG